MILQALVEYADRESLLPPPGFQAGRRPIDWILDVAETEPPRLTPTPEEAPLEIWIPEAGARNNREMPAPQPFADDSEYVFGLVRESGKPERVNDFETGGVCFLTKVIR